MRRYLMLLALIAAVTPIDLLLAQEAPPLRNDFRRGRAPLYAGEVVRVTAPDLPISPIEGRVIALGSDSLIVEARKQPDERLAIPMESITVLERLDESTSGVGAVLGVLAGLAGGAALAGELSKNASDLVRSLSVVGGALVGGFGGYLGGVQVERWITGDKWQNVPLSDIRVGFGPTRRGDLVLSVSFSF